MAAYDHQEQERLEEIKAWWQEWGGYVTALALVAVLVLAGFQGWRWWKANQAEGASTLYFAVSDAVEAKNLTHAKEAMAKLATGFRSTGYAPRAALLTAKSLWDADDKAGAQAQLQWVIDNASESDLKDIARYRLAETLVEEEKFDDAILMLSAKHSPVFEGLYADIRGDALYGAGRHDEARAAYQAALLKVEGAYRTFVQLKLDGLGGPVNPAAPADGSNASDAPSGNAP
jgi:predicted negative regulator of RcsB-dependent stress response